MDTIHVTGEGNAYFYDWSRHRETLDSLTRVCSLRTFTQSVFSLFSLARYWPSPGSNLSRSLSLFSVGPSKGGSETDTKGSKKRRAKASKYKDAASWMSEQMKWEGKVAITFNVDTTARAQISWCNLGALEHLSLPHVRSPPKKWAKERAKRKQGIRRGGCSCEKWLDWIALESNWIELA